MSKVQDEVQLWFRAPLGAMRSHVHYTRQRESCVSNRSILLMRQGLAEGDDRTEKNELLLLRYADPHLKTLQIISLAQEST